MAASPDNTCLSRPDNANDHVDAKAYPRAGLEEPENVSPAERQHALLESYNQLRERMQRTTNALASAAHDLKTPLAILNGYIELLRSGKLGPPLQSVRALAGLNLNEDAGQREALSHCEALKGLLLGLKAKARAALL